MEKETAEAVLIEAIEKTDEIHEQIRQYEQNCLNSIILRYSLSKKIIIDPEKVSRYDDPENNNRWEWYYDGKYFLMSRELMAYVENGMPKFKISIDYNKELVFNNEL